MKKTETTNSSDKEQYFTKPVNKNNHCFEPIWPNISVSAIVDKLGPLELYERKWGISLMAILPLVDGQDLIELRGSTVQGVYVYHNASDIYADFDKKYLIDITTHQKFLFKNFKRTWAYKKEDIDSL